MPCCNNNDYQSMRQAQVFAGRREMPVGRGLRSDCAMPFPGPVCGDDTQFPPGMAYVPFQKWQYIYEPEQGLMEGTIFKELNLQFCGVRGCRK